MNEDQYPMAQLLRRLYDLAWFIVAISCLLLATALGLSSTHADHRVVLTLGLAASLIAALLEYRQKIVYENDHVESALLSDALRAKYLNSFAKLRHRLGSANVLLIVAGILVSGYGAFWGVH